MSKIEVEFAFEIGDLVYMRGASHDVGRKPNQFCIYERIAQQCHGGIQRLYKVGGRAELIAETLLTKDIPEYQPTSQEVMLDLLDVARTKASMTSWSLQNKESKSG